MTKWIYFGIAIVWVYVFVMRLLWEPLERFFRKMDWFYEGTRDKTAKVWAALWPLYAIIFPVLLVTAGPFMIAERLNKQVDRRRKKRAVAAEMAAKNLPADLPKPAASYDPKKLQQMDAVARALKLDPSAGVAVEKWAQLNRLEAIQISLREQGLIN